MCIKSRFDMVHVLHGTQFTGLSLLHRKFGAQMAWNRIFWNNISAKIVILIKLMKALVGGTF